MEFDLEYKIIDYILIGAAAVTGLIHLFKGLNTGFLLLTLAGAGFIGGIAVYTVNFYRNLVVLASIPFTLAQMVFYYRYYGSNLGLYEFLALFVQLDFGLLAFLDKFVQLVLVLSAVFYLLRNLAGLKGVIDS